MPSTSGSSFAAKIVLACSVFIVAADNFAVAGLLPKLSSSFSSIPATMGQIVTCYAVSYALLCPFLAALARGLSSKRVIAVGLLVFAVGELGFFFAFDFWSALVSRILAGIGAGLVTPAATGLATKLAPPASRNQSISLMMTALCAAAAFGAPVLVLASTFMSWRLGILFLGSVSVALSLVLTATLPDDGDTRFADTTGWLAPIFDVRISLTLLSTFLVLVGLYMAYTYSRVIMAGATAGKSDRLALLLAIWGLAGLAGTFMGRSVDRFGIRLFVNALLAVLFFDLLILRLVGDSFFGAAVAIALWGACAWAFMIPQQGRLISVAPQLATLLVALHVTAVYAGTSTAAVFGGLVIVHWGGNWLLVCSAAFVLAGWVASILQEAVSAKAATTQTVPTFSRAKKLSNQGTIEGTTSR